MNEFLARWDVMAKHGTKEHVDRQIFLLMVIAKALLLMLWKIWGEANMDEFDTIFGLNK